ncbi:MAG: hypothetical protein J2P36_22095 [Ktedonobacteraceae bacterium]|nr:hypothetical protein [Ktedonobacteraceae bacterium]
MTEDKAAQEAEGVNTNPSKQAVAGSSPVSRFSCETAVLNALLKPLGDKRAVVANGEGGFLFDEKAFNGHLPSCSGNHLLHMSHADKSGHSLAEAGGSSLELLLDHYKPCFRKTQGRQVVSQKTVITIHDGCLSLDTPHPHAPTATGRNTMGKRSEFAG